LVRLGSFELYPREILGITVRELDKLVDICQLSARFTALREPAAAITWARELNGVAKKLLTPSVLDAVVKKVNDKRVTNSKDLRKLRRFSATRLPNSISLARGDIDSALLRVFGPATKSAFLGKRHSRLNGSREQVSWTE